MKLQNQICRLSQAKRLKELGIIQKSLFFIDETDRITFWTDNKDYPKLLIDIKQYAAFTVAELAIMLPYNVPSLLVENHFNPYTNEWEAYLNTTYKPPKLLAEVAGDTEAEARAALLILILEVKEIDVDQVNERLLNSNL